MSKGVRRAGRLGLGVVGLVWLLVLVSGATTLRGQTSCGSVGAAVTPDYQFAAGSSDGPGAFTWTLNGKIIASGATTQLALFHFDNSLKSTSGIAPVQSSGTSFPSGQWGTALAIGSGGILAYPAAGNLSVQDGTVEMWVSPQFDGSSSIYTQTPQVLFQFFWGPNGDQLVLAMDNNGRFYTGAGAGVSTGGASMTAWKAGSWHHLAWSYSTTHGRIRLYADGSLVSEFDTAIKIAPIASGTSFTVGSDPFGHASAFSIDEILVSNAEKDASQILYDAARSTPFGNNEILLPLSGLAAGNLGYSFTPPGAAAACGTASFAYSGIPITNLKPASGLLAPASTSVSVSFNTVQATTCGYSVGSLAAFSAMKPFEAAPAINHQGLLAGLSPSPQVVNTVYIRCASNSDYVQQVQYRSVPALNPPFPRISSLWYGSDLLLNNPSKAKEAGLFLSSYLSNSQLSSLRALNPNAIVTSGYGATYSPPPGIPYPDSYLLKDIHGQPIEIYPQSYQMNLTKPEVAEFIANLAYQSIVQSNLGLDGIFFDSFSLNVPATFVDRYGNALQVDANGDGVPDDQATLNAAWRAGMLHLIDTFHTLMPYAYTTGHMGLDPDLLSRFSGVSLGFLAADAREGRVPFSALWDNYKTWIAGARQPALVNLQSAPPNQIAYGYGQPTKAPPSLMEFGRTFYPNMRFGLATALMNDGYFNHDPGDATTLVNWWYDEYDFSLGYPLGPVTPLASAPASMLTNGGFEGSLSNWNFSVFNDGQSNATVTLDSGIAAEGSSSARIAVAAASPVVWHVDLEQDGLTLAKGVGYELQFWARADSPRTITLNSQAGAPGFAEEGLATTMAITTSWSLYKVSFIASADVTDGRIQFWVGDAAGTVWLDGVQLAPSAPGLYRRDFSNGIALLNGTTSSQTFKLESGFQRFSGSQAPKYQYFVDDTGTAFTSTGAWSSVPYDSGVIWDNGAPTSSAEAFGPYYHAWQGTAHQLDTANGTAQWALNVPEDGQYTIQIWLPAAPQATTWTKNAIYEVVSGGSVVATAAVDQTQAAAVDGLHMIATVKLTAAGSPLVRVHNGGSGSLIADAVYVMSAALYNDGSSAPQVTLAPMDGILLKRQQAASVPASRVNSVVNAANFLPAIASAGFISIVGTGFGNSSRAWASSDFSGSNLPLSMDGISVTINGKPAYVEYISATQINAIVPDDDTIGTVQVIVNTPQGPSYAGSVMKQKLSPAFFTYTPGTNTYAAAVHLDGTLVGPAGPSSRPAAPGEVIEIYGTGFGPTNPALPTSQLISQPAPLLFPATISIGGVPAEVQFAGLVSSGLYQMNVKIPSIPDGDQLTQATVSGFQTVPNVFLSISAK